METIVDVAAFEAKTIKDLGDFITDFLVREDANAVQTSLVYNGIGYAALLTYSTKIASGC